MPSPEFLAHLAMVSEASTQLRRLKEHRAAFAAELERHLASLDNQIAFAQKRLDDAMAKHVEECKCLT